ncbi:MULTISPECIES: serine/threonine protein kinase [unclassified Rhizobium]|uniref:serine/threonine protein kinase n=1 Tax=unclassified Rhizobium TaxID=2613769 RepID=UPI001ADB7FF5|nr:MULTISPECIES: serine/threonine-protein kinase [unclassified Rhizobium]MBO9101110.1 serine/threonine protein kinase [Rhizobium sp. L58/93]MBO9168374.1 serine/threonine protein kinase [Rhizobium sp. L245/93]QXZ88176.1 serine/threonine protein kinase [Rhizobium sp. K1/93]QXZ94350.1 serine/threonine protein kinase [Rhizobium sp. K15/93]QYA05756.1 serine/threonine protein kinase [Rhizobium sp. B21/90]
MAKTYGGRWRIDSPVSSGGQAEVFLASDMAAEFSEKLVLKRVKNPKRHDRFRNEVEAVKRLNHPNIIKLIDHSALSSENTASEKQFIIMPYAESGDLSKRVDLYKGNLDSVLQVARSIAVGLAAAHEAGVIHRDIKPQNILFPTLSHDIWIADFGICLLSDVDRSTLDGEVVGPVQFMAPELEGGGHLDVTAAADVYSLGKVIYFMFTGGTILPRERLHEPGFSSVFAEGERLGLLQHLLARMMCPLDRRLKSMREVISEIDRIQDWERSATSLPISPGSLSKIAKMKQEALAVQQQSDANLDTRQRRSVALARTVEGTKLWFLAELEKVAVLLRDDEIITAGVRTVEGQANGSPSLNRFRPVQATELWLQNRSESSRREHVLRFSIGPTGGTVSVFSEMVGGSTPSMRAPRPEPENTDLLLMPSYGRKPISSTKDFDWQVFRMDGELHTMEQRPVPNGPRSIPRHREPVSIMALQFSTSDWPKAAGDYPKILEATIDTFMTAINRQYL